MGFLKKEYMRARVKHLKKYVPIRSVLKHYHIELRLTDQEEQYPCPLHGDGQDQGYSGRVYPETDSTYCWGCQQARDQIKWVQDRESVSFMDAIHILEKAFEVPALPDIYEFYDNSGGESQGSSRAENGNTLTNKIKSLLDNSEEQVSFEYIEKKIMRAIEDYPERIGIERALKMFYVYDSVLYDIHRDSLSPEDGKKILLALHTKLKGIIA